MWQRLPFWAKVLIILFVLSWLGLLPLTVSLIEYAINQLHTIAHTLPKSVHT
jgi:hypothetical protein